MFGAWAALVGLAGARVRRRAGALLAVALGVAAAAAAVLAASPLSLVSGQSAMERSLRSVAPAERAVRVTVVRDAGGPASLDSTVRDALRGPVFAPGQARAVRFGGRSADRLRALHRAAGFPDGTLGSVVLTGVDAPERWISLSSGRLPRSCVPAACEVVAVGGGRRLPRAFALQGMHMRVVGRGRLDGVPLGAVPPGPGSVDSAASFVVASGVEDLSALRPLRSVVRTFAWARVLDPAAVHPWTAGRLLDELLDTRTQLLSSLSSAEVRGPSERIAAEQARGRAAGAFSLVIAGLAATVLLAFAAFAAAEQHAGVALELGRLRAMAARRRHLVALVLAEAAVPALFGVLLGFGLAACAGLVAAGWAGVPAGPVLREGLFSFGQITAAVVLWAAAVVVVAGVLGGAQSRGIRIALEAGCAVVIGALLWQAASRGRVDAAELARDGTADPVLLLAPGAVALACGLIALRVVPALLRALARFAGRPPTRLRRAPTRVRRARSIGAYLTLVFLARAPGRTAAAVAVVAVAAAAATFALGHARALQRGELDQAAYRTAGDVRTLAAVPGAPDARGTPVIRAQAETLATSTPVQLLGVGAEALPRLPGWRADFSPVPLSTLARRLDGDPGGVRMRGIEIPRTAISARRLFVVHHGATGNVVSLQGASLEVAEGEMVAVMGPSGSGKSTLLACLSGLQAVTAGELHVFGARLDAASARALAKHRARTVAVVSQDAGRALGDDQPVGARIALRARLAGMGSRNAKHRAAELLERVGLEGRGKARRTELSGGEQQRAALCVAIAVRPKLLLVDEVTGQLDAATGRSILQLLSGLARDEGATVLLATHDPRAAEVADRVVTIRDGRVTGELHGADGRRYVFVDDGGLIRLDPDDLRSAGIASAAEVAVGRGMVVLRGTGAPAAYAEAPERRVANGGEERVRLEHVRRRFRTRAETVDAVAGVTLALKAGAFHAIVGPSGCGKTTLLHLIAGLDRADHGTVTIAGEDVAGRSREQLAQLRARAVAIVPQVSALVAGLSALDNVALGLRARGENASVARTRAHAALQEVDLHELSKRPASGLSGGERQRVALARALATHAPLIVADEPTANLDEANAIKVAELLAERARNGTCIVCATHDASVTARASAVIAMRDGRVAPGAGGAQAPPAIA